MNRNLHFQREALLQLARQHRYPLQVVRLALARGFAPARIRALIEQAVAGQNWDEAQRLVHTLKGLAPTLGAQTLHELAKAYEQDLKRGELSRQAEFSQELRRVLAAIAEQLAKP